VVVGSGKVVKREIVRKREYYAFSAQIPDVVWYDVPADGGAVEVKCARRKRQL
jgi:hypothetical protein